MGRRPQPFSLIKRPKTKFWYYKLGGWSSYRSTGESVKAEAMKVAVAALEAEGARVSGPTFRRYAEPFFLWEKCPHVRRLLNEGRSVTRYHARNMRRVLENHVFPDRLAKLRISEIRRADILDFRERLVEKMGYTRIVQLAFSVVKVILKEAYFREDISRDPTAGVGVTKYEPAEVGTFTPEELQALFPAIPPGPWGDLAGYTVFLTAATTGMRRGEILALTWKCVQFDAGYIEVRQAWKDRYELGPPKWNKTRTVPLPAVLAETLKRLRTRETHTGAGDLVFCYSDGSRLGDTWWAKRFTAALETVGIDRKARNLRPHSFRHTLNSLLRDKGYDSAKIRAALGWSDEAIQDNYTHWNPESFTGHREIVEEFFRHGSGSNG